MNDATLNEFRQIASEMGIRDEGWQWIGPHMSQRMFGISEARAKEYARLYGGEARREEAGQETPPSKGLFGFLSEHGFDVTK